MRQLHKKPCPEDLKTFVDREHPQDWPDIHRSSGFPRLYEDCLIQLMEEQDGLSGYTEKPLSQGSSLHVDHFRKRSLFRSLDNIFGWNNLIADEHNRHYGADHKDKVITSVDEYKLLIDPVAQDPHHFFTYMENGLIVPRAELDSDDRKIAEFTIHAFNLDHETLRRKREDAIRLVRLYRQAGLEEHDIKESLKDYGFVSAIEFALE